jgi:hypothetical protein
MFFSDGQDSAAGLNSFLTNFGSNPVESPTDDTPPESVSQDDAPDTDALSPQESDDGQDFSAEEFVADRLAASMAEDGYEAPESDDEDEDEAILQAKIDQADIDFESLSPEEKSRVAKEFQEFREQQEKSRASAQWAAVQSRVAEAEQAALAEVRRAFERDVLTKSEEYYRAELTKRLAAVQRAARNQDDPDTYAIQAGIAEAFAVYESRSQYERQKADDWGAIAEQARLEARQNTPEARDYVARHFAAQFGLPEEVVADIADPRRHITAFEHRAQELADMATKLSADRQQSTQKRRQQANRELQRTTTRTSSTGKSTGGKPRDWKDLDDEHRREAGAALLGLMHSR